MPRCCRQRAEAGASSSRAAARSLLLRRITMTRQNLFSHVWDGDLDEDGTLRRVFWRPDDARMGATLYELAPGAPESRIHMHFGAEEMFFVLDGRPRFRNKDGEEAL